MRTRKALAFLLPAALLLSCSGALSADSEDADTEAADELRLVEKDRRGAIYALPDVDWSSYDALLLEPATVAFRKNWQRDQNRNTRALNQRVSSADMERIKANLAELFDEVFVDELTRDGHWTLVEEAGPSVLRIRPQIVDLDVYAPDVPSSTVKNSYTRSAGEMTLKLALYDAETGDLIAAASDHRRSPDRGYMQWTTRVSNTGDARRMLQEWARGLNERLSATTGHANATATAD
jgi:hypothetical protein